VAQLVLHPQSAAGSSLPSPVTRNSGRRSARRPTSTS
jgi:hypothetical protein